jgi:hypothetical protein
MAANLPVTVQTSIDFLKAEGVIASDGHQIASECRRLPQGRSYPSSHGVRLRLMASLIASDDA